MSKCHDCGVEEGQLHEFGCDMERCPFCGGQLISCDCCYHYLHLFDWDKWYDTCHLHPNIYKNGLTEELQKEWMNILNKKGRISWIDYPNICSKCGEVNPEFFKVDEEEWNKYIQQDMRNTVICKSCYDYIKKGIDNASL